MSKNPLIYIVWLVSRLHTHKHLFIDDEMFLWQYRQNETPSIPKEPRCVFCNRLLSVCKKMEDKHA